MSNDAHSVGQPMQKGRRRGLSVPCVVTAILAGMSLLTFLLWIRSSWRWDYLHCQIPHMTFVFHANSLRNQLYFWVEQTPKPTADVKISCGSCAPPSWSNGLETYDSWSNNLVIITVDNPRPGIESGGLRFPHWVLGVLFAFVPFVRYMAHRRGRRPLRDHCGRCGYNLTGNISGVCPECGAAYKFASRAVKARIPRN
jgi:hypothetical protein